MIELIIIALYAFIGVLVMSFQTLCYPAKHFYSQFLSFIFWPVMIPVLCVRHVVEQHEKEEEK